MSHADQGRRASPPSAPAGDRILTTLDWASVASTNAPDCRREMVRQASKIRVAMQTGGNVGDAIVHARDVMGMWGV